MGSSRPQSNCRMSQTRRKAARMASMCPGSTVNFENGMAAPMAYSRFRRRCRMAVAAVKPGPPQLAWPAAEHATPAASASAPIPDTTNTESRALAFRPTRAGGGRGCRDRSRGSFRRPGKMILMAPAPTWRRSARARSTSPSNSVEACTGRRRRHGRPR
jgi:hypothetical protein